MKMSKLQGLSQCGKANAFLLSHLQYRLLVQCNQYEASPLAPCGITLHSLKSLLQSNASPVCQLVYLLFSY